MKNLEIASAKIYSREAVVRQVAIWRFKGKKIVFTNGCFDILHLGHLEYLAKSRDLGDVLVVGLNSDASVTGIKGPGRPINYGHSRAVALASLSFVSAVVFFDEETPYELIKLVKPDILVKGNDYTPEQIVGSDVVLGSGGKVETIELTEGFSTTGLIEKIRGATGNG
jgi:D-glycero-beta-D-manno-heptose 1-phosphate adenylyltransferase